MSERKMSQESNSSTGSKLSLSLSQETVDYMYRDVGDIANRDLCDFTNICARDVSKKKDASQGRTDNTEERCCDLTTTSRSVCDPVSNTKNQQAASSPGTASSATLSSLPSTAIFGGDYTFKVTLSVQRKETKAVDWIYSEKLRKVFVRFEASCPFLFSVSHDAPRGCVIRAMPIFVRPQHMHEIVRRCPHHSAVSASNGCTGEGVPPSDHLIRCEHKLAKYQEDSANGFHSVVVPYDVPPEDMEWKSYLYQFTCFSSCVGGLNRRPFQVIFTLEDTSGHVLGRCVIEVRICACPGRDRQIEEKNASSSHTVKPVASSSSVKPTAAATSTATCAIPVPKRRRCNDDATNVFNLTVCGAENYAILCHMRDSLEVSSALPQPQFEQIRTQQESRRKSFMDMPPPLLVVASSALKLNGVTLPRVGNQEVEPSNSNCDSSSATTTSSSSATWKKYSCENRIKTWLQRHTLSSCIEVFNKLNLVFMKQIENFQLHDFEKLGLAEDDLARVWLAFTRLQRHDNK